MSDRDLFNLEGRNGLVTGGGRGLGKAMALSLARYGANVALLDIDFDTAQDTAQEIKALGVQSLTLRGDVRSEDDAEQAVSAVVEAWDSLDVLVNNAGISTTAPAQDLSLADFKRVYEIDVFGVFIFSKAAFKPMAQQKRGNIVNIASMAGISVLWPSHNVHYHSAKAAVIMLTKGLAVEWESYGIRVNAIAPGYMITPAVSELKQEDPERWEDWMSRVPMNRAGDPTELQGAVIYLASDASSYMTGSVMVIDGGYTCL